MKRSRGSRVGLASWTGGAFLLPLLLLAGSSSAQQDQRECELTQIGQIPLPDAGGLYYRRIDLTPEYSSTEPTGDEWRLAGLYAEGRTTRPPAHDAAGLAIGESLQPIEGKIVMLSIGMSNTAQEFGRFRARAQADPTVHPDLVIVNGAQGSRPLDVWTDPTDATWDEVDSRLSQAGLTPDQVQVAWIKHAVRSPMFPPLDFPTHPETIEAMLEDMIRALKIRYPNVVLTYMSSRTRAYNSNQEAQSPEPAAYEGGFAVQWMLEKQIAGDPNLRYDGADPPAPWLSWGPYLWTDGTGAPFPEPPSPFDARSDGFIYTCADVDRDGVHPSPPTPDPNEPQGEFKVGDQIMAYFLTDKTTAPWFLGSTTGGPSITSLLANGQEVLGGSINGSVPFAVAFSATISGAVAGQSWTYDDGTFSFLAEGNTGGSPYFDENPSPTKVFRVPGTYDVCLTVRDGLGNATRECFEVIVTGATSGAPNAWASVPRTVVQFSVYPNPSDSKVTFRYELAAPSRVTIEIFDSSGRRLDILESRADQAGVHEAYWRDSARAGVPSGAYYARITAGVETRTVPFVRVP